ncbi:MAG: hypothetical protein H6585_09300 [Flavobacteriales bacterium]|nr:hypothetical protein [Flavobacteriales bacterium]MCB9448524.1 hypothetical protein [Flavobacteriales bacterium]
MSEQPKNTEKPASVAGTSQQEDSWKAIAAFIQHPLVIGLLSGAAGYYVGHRGKEVAVLRCEYLTKQLQRLEREKEELRKKLRAQQEEIFTLKAKLEMAQQQAAQSKTLPFGEPRALREPDGTQKPYGRIMLD